MAASDPNFIIHCQYETEKMYTMGLVFHMVFHMVNKIYLFKKNKKNLLTHSSDHILFSIDKNIFL